MRAQQCRARREPRAANDTQKNSNGQPSIGVTAGPVSGNLKLAKIEGRTAHYMRGLQNLAFTTGLKNLWDSVSHGWLGQSLPEGYNFFYSLQQLLADNTKMASGPATAEELAAKSEEKTKVLAETRGVGGKGVNVWHLSSIGRQGAGETAGQGTCHGVGQGPDHSLERSAAGLTPTGGGTR